jgi:hypothetical protein
MKNNRKLAFWLAIGCIIGFAISVEAVEMNNITDQPPTITTILLGKMGIMTKDIPQIPPYKSFDSLEAMPGVARSNDLRNLFVKPHVPQPKRAAIMPIPTTWDVTFMPIPTQWDAQIIFISAGEAVGRELAVTGQLAAEE